MPVFTCDLKCVAEGVEVVSHVGSDNLQGGKLAGQAMIEALGEEGGKVLVVHFPQANSCQLRVQGFKQVIDGYNAGRETGEIVVVSELDGGGVRDEGYKVTEDTLQHILTWLGSLRLMIHPHWEHGLHLKKQVSKIR